MMEQTHVFDANLQKERLSEYKQTEESTAPSGGASLGAHVSKTSQAPSRPSRTVDETLGAYPVNDDFWGNTNPTDVSTNTANSEDMMAGSHITKFHTHEHEEPVTTELLNKISNTPGVVCKHNICQEHHNRSDTQSTTSVDYKLAILASVVVCTCDLVA